MTSVTDERLQRAARALADCKSDETTLDRLPAELRPESYEEAYKVQRFVSLLLKTPALAWKVSASGPDGATAAPISRLWTTETSVAKVNTIETEIALRLSSDLDTGRAQNLSREHIVRSVDQYALAFELVDWRLTAEDLSFAERLADCLATDGLIVGPARDFHGELPETEASLCLFRNEIPSACELKSIDPIEAIRAYVNRGGDQFEGFKAGQWITTGSLTGMHEAGPPASWRAELDGKLSVTLNCAL